MSRTIMELRNVSKVYPMGEVRITALDRADLRIPEGAFASISGPSGAGKSTMLHLIGLLDNPTSGDVLLRGRNIKGMGDKEKALFRKQNIGFVFQFFNLVPTLSALENVVLSRMFDRDKRVSKARELLDLVGMEHRMDHLPTELSGGERQRVAIARALINDPPIILADEPTGNLDSETSMEILDLFRALNNRGKTVIIVTHERDIARYTSMRIRMRDGKVVREKR